MMLSLQTNNLEIFFYLHPLKVRYYNKRFENREKYTIRNEKNINSDIISE